MKPVLTEDKKYISNADDHFDDENKGDSTRDLGNTNLKT